MQGDTPGRRVRSGSKHESSIRRPRPSVLLDRFRARQDAATSSRLRRWSDRPTDGPAPMPMPLPVASPPPLPPIVPSLPRDATGHGQGPGRRRRRLMHAAPSILPRQSRPSYVIRVTSCSTAGHIYIHYLYVRAYSLPAGYGDCFCTPCLSFRRSVDAKSPWMVSTAGGREWRGRGAGRSRDKRKSSRVLAKEGSRLDVARGPPERPSLAACSMSPSMNSSSTRLASRSVSIRWPLALACPILGRCLRCPAVYASA